MSENGSSRLRVRDRSRPLDVILWGATGFTGQLVAEYLLEATRGGDLRWALAGRSEDKLRRVRGDLAKIDPRAAELPIRLGDSHDATALSKLAAEASVICSTVGPYARYGGPLVAACVEHGTDYCDLAGETQWIRRMIDAHHEEAQRTGARIVPCCGFDSIPSDVGTFMLQEHALAEHGAPCSEIKFFAGRSRGSASGGTIQSIFNLVDEAKRDRSVLSAIGNPYALNPEGERRGPDRSDQKGVRFDPDLGEWTGPFVMAAINTRVVRRSNALLDYRYGKDFRYSEVAAFGAGPRGALRASGMAAGLSAFLAAAAVGPARNLLARRLPSPGEGPDREARERGFFIVHLVGKGHDAQGKPFELRGRVEGKRDPGYGETAKMLGESALCLAVDGASLDAAGGLLTPAATMGQRLLERLRAADMVFEVRAV